MTTYDDTATVTLTLSEFLSLQCAVWDAINAAREKDHHYTADSYRKLESVLFSQVRDDMSAAAEHLAEKMAREKMENKS